MPKNQVPQYMNDKQRIPRKYQEQRMISSLNKLSSGWGQKGEEWGQRKGEDSNLSHPL